MIKSAYLGTTVFTVVRHKDGENRTFDAQCKIDMAVYIGASDIDAAVDMGIARGIGLNVRESLSHLEWICRFSEETKKLPASLELYLVQHTGDFPWEVKKQ